MNKTSRKRLAALLAAGCMMLPLGGCALFGGGQTAESTMTAEEYLGEFEDIAEEMLDTQEELASFDPSAADAADEIQDMKEPYEAFMALNPPADYAEAHEEMQDGCEAMLDYIDAATGGEGAESASEMLQTVVDHFAEAATLIAQLDAA